MSGALSHALDAVGRDLERGILAAERDLADAREYCRSLENEVRSLRAALRPLDPELTALLSAAADPHPVAHEDETSTDYMPILEELWGIARRDPSS